MKKLIIRVIKFNVLLACTVFTLICLTTVFVKRNDFKNWQTESNLLIMPGDETHDLMFLGTSHARQFSRHNNHTKVSELLNTEFINLGSTDGGILNQQTYL